MNMYSIEEEYLKQTNQFWSSCKWIMNSSTHHFPSLSIPSFGIWIVKQIPSVALPFIWIFISFPQAFSFNRILFIISSLHLQLSNLLILIHDTQYILFLFNHPFLFNISSLHLTSRLFIGTTVSLFNST